MLCYDASILSFSQFIQFWHKTMKVYVVAGLIFGLLSVCASQDSSNTTLRITTIQHPNSTTEIPTTAVHTVTPAATTEVPTTTAEVPTTTAEVPTTTTEVPTTTPEVPAITTTSAPPVTSPPGGGDLKTGTWRVNEIGTNNSCIILQAAIQFQITYQQINRTNQTKLNVPGDATTDELSSCETNTIGLTFGDNSFVMMFVQEKGKVHVKEVSIKYYIDDAMFPGAIHNGSEVHLTKDNLTLFEASKGKSYLCKDGAKIDINDTTVALTDVQVEAFRNNTEHTGFSDAEECSSDEKISDIVPIAVGCALAALVIIVLIAYLVGRQRNRQRGYQSV